MAFAWNVASTRSFDLASVETTVKYAGYLKQEAPERDVRGRTSVAGFPLDFQFARFLDFRTKPRSGSSQVRPETLGQAARIPGMTPAAVAVLGAYLGRLSLGLVAGR